MQLTKKGLVLLTLIGVATIGAWQLGRHNVSPSAPLPEEERGMIQGQGTDNAAKVKPDSSEWARRQTARENASDVQSLSRTFKEANDCLLYHAVLNRIGSMLKDDRLDDLSNEKLATLENIDAASGMYLSIARRTESFCKGSDRDELARTYTDAIFKAALLGDPDAESCFVTSDLSPLEIRSAASLEFLEKRYLKHAPVFTQNALERGDPYVADNALYRHIATQGAHPSRLDNLQKADPFLTWRMARLASFRVLPEQRLRLESRLSLFEEQNLLQPDDIKRADAWARDVYEREFVCQRPINLDSHQACYASPELAM